MSLNANAIAVSGLGFGVLAIAVSGLLPTQAAKTIGGAPSVIEYVSFERNSEQVAAIAAMHQQDEEAVLAAIIAFVQNTA